MSSYCFVHRKRQITNHSSVKNCMVQNTHLSCSRDDRGTKLHFKEPWKHMNEFQFVNDVMHCGMFTFNSGVKATEVQHYSNRIMKRYTWTATHINRTHPHPNSVFPCWPNEAAERIIPITCISIAERIILFRCKVWKIKLHISISSRSLLPLTSFSFFRLYNSAINRAKRTVLSLNYPHSRTTDRWLELEPRVALVLD